MARRSWSAPVKTSSVMVGADWANYIETFHNAVIACGLTQTSDTGQLSTLNPATYVAPTTVTVLGYRVYKFNDALSTTSPVFIKVTFKSTSGRLPAMEIVAGGPTTNGAGEILNKTTVLGQISGSTSSDYTGTVILPGEFMSYVSAGEGYLAFALGVGSKVYQSSGSSAFSPTGLPVDWFVVSRPVDTSGELLSDRVSVITANYGALGSTSGYVTTGGFLSGQVSAVKYGASPSYSRSFTSAVCPETVRTISGSVVIARCYGDFRDSTLRVNPAVGGVPLLAVSPWGYDEYRTIWSSGKRVYCSGRRDGACKYESILKFRHGFNQGFRYVLRSAIQMGWA